MSSTGVKRHVCAWPKCNAVVQPHEYLPIVGENTGRVYACRQHRNKLEIGKTVVGAAGVAAFQAGMDRAAPGLREKIGVAGMTLLGIWRDVQDTLQKRDEPAE